MASPLCPGPRPGPRSPARPLLTAAALLLVTACAAPRGTPPDAADPLLSEAGAPSTRCVPESEPERMPGADQLVDSAGLVNAVRALRVGDEPASGHVLLTLAFDALGMNVRRDVLEHSTRPLVADSVQRLVFSARREVAESAGEWGVRLRVDMGDGVALRVGRRLYCPPVPRDHRLDTMMQGFTPSGTRFRGGIRERTVHMRARVDELGIISTARIERGELSGSAIEMEITSYLRQFLFAPATLDGVPTPSYVSIPVRIRG